MSSIDNPTADSTVSVFHQDGMTTVHYKSDLGFQQFVQVYDADREGLGAHVVSGIPDGSAQNRVVVPDEAFIEFARGVAEVNEIVVARVAARNAGQSEALVEDEPNDDDDAQASIDRGGQLLDSLRSTATGNATADAVEAHIEKSASTSGVSA
ncbi:unannotated protein [freshwater metagenome]|uniref:Unannotated protein n=1 Tax=freshwater metagenome TaxID=449393 RepID=A0A6J7FL43_9ZZZZ|nr:hypothetical protein [Actinomycetota bacterium]